MRVSYRRQYQGGAERQVPDFLKSEFASGTWERTGVVWCGVGWCGVVWVSVVWCGALCQELWGALIMCWNKGMRTVL